MEGGFGCMLWSMLYSCRVLPAPCRLALPLLAPLLHTKKNTQKTRKTKHNTNKTKQNTKHTLYLDVGCRAAGGAAGDNGHLAGDGDSDQVLKEEGE